MINVLGLPRDNGGRRVLKDRRFFVSRISDKSRRTNWRRREGLDRRIRRRAK